MAGGRCGAIVMGAALLAAGCGETGPEADVPENRGEAATPAPLPELAGRVILSGCRQGQCAWLRFVRLERVRSLSDGELRRLVARRGFSRYGFDAEPPSEFGDGVEVAWEPADASAYAFCSTARPSYAFADEDGGLILHRLDLFDLAGYQTASATLYMRICHGRDYPWEDASALGRLGYRPGTPSEQREVASPAEMIGP